MSSTPIRHFLIACPAFLNPFNPKADFMQGYGRELPENGLIVHTDQGSQYTSGNFRTLLKQHKAIHSNSRKGNPYDNAMMESFYRTLKRELIRDAKFETLEQA